MGSTERPQSNTAGAETAAATEDEEGDTAAAAAAATERDSTSRRPTAVAHVLPKLLSAMDTPNRAEPATTRCNELHGAATAEDINELHQGAAAEEPERSGAAGEGEGEGESISSGGREIL